MSGIFIFNTILSSTSLFQILNMKFFYEVLIAALAFVIIGFAYQNQPRISQNGGKGWDGSTYYKIAEQYQNGSKVITAEAPFGKRIGTPFLIATYSKFTGKTLLESAFLLDIAGAFVILLLLILWLRRFVTDFRARLLIYFLYLMVWHGPLRLSFFYPMMSDIWATVWLLAGLLLLDIIREHKLKKNKISILLVIVLSAVIFIGIFFRESNIILAIAAPFILNPFNNYKTEEGFFNFSHLTDFIKKTFQLYIKRESLLLFIPFLFAVVSSLVVSKFTNLTYDTGYSYIKSVFSWFYLKSLPQYLLAILICYGPVLLLVPFYFNSYKSLLSQKQDLTILLLLILILAYIGGTDTERIFFMSSFPIVFILIGISIEQLLQSSQRWWLVALLLIQTIAYRFYWFTPDSIATTDKKPYPFFTLIGSNFEYLDLYTAFGSSVLNTFLLVEYTGLFILIGWIINNNSKNKLRQ